MDWLSLFIGWLGGIPSGLVGNLLYHKYLEWRKRKSKADYFTSTWSENTVKFEGQVSSGTVDMGEIARRVLGLQDKASK